MTPQDARMAILTRSFSDELEKIALTMPSRGAAMKAVGRGGLYGGLGLAALAALASGGQSQADEMGRMTGLRPSPPPGSVGPDKLEILRASQQGARPPVGPWKAPGLGWERLRQFRASHPNIASGDAPDTTPVNWPDDPYATTPVNWADPEPRPPYRPLADPEPETASRPNLASLQQSSGQDDWATQMQGARSDTHFGRRYQQRKP